MFNSFNPNQFSQSPQQQQPNMQQYQQQVSFNQFKQQLQTINQVVTLPELQTLLTYLRIIQESASKQINDACKQSDFLKREQQTPNRTQTNQSIKQRCFKIKTRNHKLLKGLLNLREKLVNKMYMYKSVSPVQQTEMESLTEKIKYTKMQIANKMTKLRFHRVNKVDNHNAQQQGLLFSPFKAPLVELRKGTELLEKESMNMREELKLVVRLAHGENI